MKSASAENIFSSHVTLSYLYRDKKSEVEARNQFESFKKAGVINEKSSFDDTTWYATDQYADYGFHFHFNQFTYASYQILLKMDLNTFCTCVKIYIISLFGVMAMTTIKMILSDIKNVVGTDRAQLENVKLQSPYHVINFFTMIVDDTGLDDASNFIDNLDCIAAASQVCTNQRLLAQCDTYFKFDAILKNFWQKDLTKKERLFYFPMYIWWTVTAVIPLRPKELLLTPRNCLKKKNGEYWLTVRRSKLKRESGRLHDVTYTLDGDFMTDSYPIPDELGDQINQYISWTHNCRQSSINTLFAMGPHIDMIRVNHPNDRSFYSRRSILTAINYFYHDVIEGIYHMRIVENDSNLHDDEIEMIHLGDTRHIALINLMQSGGTPASAMLLAGHTNDEMASHYYSNIKTFIECQTYQEYRRMVTGNQSFKLTKPQMIPAHMDYIILSDGGRCYSGNYMNGKYDDCVKSIGPHAEIGYCQTCDLYRPSALDWIDGEKQLDQRLRDDCKLLADAIQIVRKGKGETATITEQLLKLHGTSASYANFLLEKKMKNERKTNSGKKKTHRG